MAKFNTSDYETGFAQDGVKQYVQVPAEMAVSAGDTFEGWVYIPESKPSGASRRAPKKPARWQYEVRTVRGIGQTFVPDDEEAGAPVKRAYIEKTVTETVNA